MRRARPAVVLAAAALAAIAGCATPRSPAEATVDGAALAYASTLLCGGRIATIGIRGNRPVLVADGRERVVRKAPSATGARYEAIDAPDTWIWHRGATAIVSVDGRGWPECTVLQAAAGSPRTPLPIVARGNEPAWRLELDTQRIRFVPGMAGTPVDAATPTARPAGAGRFWVTASSGRKLTVLALDRVCADSMSGMPHPIAVTVEWDGRTWRGCGGEPASLLRGAEWVVEDIDHRGVVDRSRATLGFLPDGRIDGRASCNDYTGRWTLTGENLRVTEVAVGTRACAPALMDQERRFLERLAAIHRFEITTDGALVLRDAADGALLARR